MISSYTWHLLIVKSEFCCTKVTAKHFTLIIVSVRCRFVFISVDVSAAVVSFDGDNEMEDTVRLFRFLLGCSDDGGGDDEADD